MSPLRFEDYFTYEPDTGIIRHIKNKKQAGYIKRRYRILSKFKKQYPGHSIAWYLHYGVWPKHEIDHINGIPSDNRIINLRHVTHAENQLNRGLDKRNTVGVSGIFWDNIAKGWRVHLQCGETKVSKRTTDFFEACCIRFSAMNKLPFHKNHGAPR